MTDTDADEMRAIRAANKKYRQRLAWEAWWNRNAFKVLVFVTTLLIVLRIVMRR